ncbi:hypothetical protein GE09DRAFT_262617 [Coniochaeta sp. 2T2.1]|nr:hypothetical protein GE09DRAFT_262617 [Coniochaeta sp. 2T2.1]
MSNHWRGKGRGRYQSSRPFYPKKTTDISSVPAPPLGTLIQSLAKHDLDNDAEAYLDSARIQDCELVASYNWLDKSDPAMIIPGRPPRWTPLPGENKLPQDSGDYFRDKNAARYPAHLMEATVLAALSLRPDLRAADVDVVACYSSLGNLVRFVLGRDKSFRILVQAMGNSVFFVRRENSPTEKIEGIRGHGHTFPEAYTTWDPEVRGSDTSHRILKYRFGGLRMLVRAEADAYVAGEGDESPSLSSRAAEKESASATSPTRAKDIALLNTLMSSLSPTSNASPPSSTPPTKISINTNPATGVTPVSQSQILEIKTRGIWKKDKEDMIAEEMPKLWLAQVPNFMVAYHDRGTFEADIKVQDVKLRVDRWEKMAKRDLAALAALLHRLIGLVRERAAGSIELCRTGMGELEVREWGGDVGEVVSEETKGRWVGGGVQITGSAAGVWKEEEAQPDAGDGGVELNVGVDGEWEGDKDWTHCSAECGYCGGCRK